MTVNVTDTELRDGGDGATTVFNFTFKAFNVDDIEVYFIDSDGNYNLQTTGFTITLNSNGNGGQITFLVAPANDVDVYLKRVMDKTQPTPIPIAQEFDEKKFEQMVDRAVMIAQEIARDGSAAIRVPDGESSSIKILPTAANRANKIMAFDADGDVIVSNLDLDVIENPGQSAIDAQAAAAAAAASETNASNSEAAALAAQLAAEAAASGMKWRPSVHAATAAALPACTYSNGSAGVGATLTGNANGALSAIDGVTPVVDRRYLIQNQAAPAQNGVYVLTQLGNGSTPFILTRATDADTWNELSSQVVAADEGTTWADYTFICTSNQGGTVGTTAVNWSTFKIVIPDGSITFAKLASAAITTNIFVNSATTIPTSKAVADRAVLQVGMNTVTGVSGVMIPFEDGYDYEIDYDNVFGNTTAQALYGRFTTDGITPITAANSHQYGYVRNQGTTVAGNSVVTNLMALSATTWGTNAATSVCGTLRVYAPRVNGLRTRICGFCNGFSEAGVYGVATISAEKTNGEDNLSLWLYPSSGTMTGNFNVKRIPRAV